MRFFQDPEERLLWRTPGKQTVREVLYGELSRCPGGANYLKKALAGPDLAKNHMGSKFNYNVI
jgi:hypothetical protein